MNVWENRSATERDKKKYWIQWKFYSIKAFVCLFEDNEETWKRRWWRWWNCSYWDEFLVIGMNLSLLYWDDDDDDGDDIQFGISYVRWIMFLNVKRKCENLFLTYLYWGKEKRYCVLFLLPILTPHTRTEKEINAHAQIYCNLIFITANFCAIFFFYILY